MMLLAFSKYNLEQAADPMASCFSKIKWISAAQGTAKGEMKPLTYLGFQ